MAKFQITIVTVSTRKFTRTIETESEDEARRIAETTTSVADLEDGLENGDWELSEYGDGTVEGYTVKPKIDTAAAGK